MVARVEPPRGRPEQRYPGLTPEERGFEPPSASVVSPEPEPPPPLWVIPSELPQTARSVGFVGPLPESQLPEPPPPEGLFDVPGLLERLWLARALEAHRERPWSPTTQDEAAPELARDRTPFPTEARSGGVPVTGLAGSPDSRGTVAPMPASSVPRAGSTPPEPASGPVPIAPPSRPRSWVCPYCYLTNNADATTCRGCRSGSLHL